VCCAHIVLLSLLSSLDVKFENFLIQLTNKNNSSLL
jgi:hypothetical protein